MYGLDSVDLLHENKCKRMIPATDHHRKRRRRVSSETGVFWDGETMGRVEGLQRHCG